MIDVGLQVRDALLDHGCRPLAAFQNLLQSLGSRSFVLFRFQSDFGVIDDRHVEPVIDRFVHEHAVEHTPRVGVESERNVADAEDCFYLGQLALDLLDGFQGFDSGRTVFLLPG